MNILKGKADFHVKHYDFLSGAMRVYVGPGMSHVSVVPYLCCASHTSAHWTDFLTAANITNISNTPRTLNREVKYF